LLQLSPYFTSFEFEIVMMCPGDGSGFSRAVRRDDTGVRLQPLRQQPEPLGFRVGYGTAEAGPVP